MTKNTMPLKPSYPSAPNPKLFLLQMSLDQTVDCEKECFDPPYSVEVLQNLFTNCATFALGIVVPQDIIAAYAIMRKIDHNHFEIMRVASLIKFRKQGYASKLVQQVEAFLLDGLGCIDLEVASNNHAALNFYKRLSYLEVGRRRAYYADRADAVLMSKLFKQ